MRSSFTSSRLVRILALLLLPACLGCPATPGPPGQSTAPLPFEGRRAILAVPASSGLVDEWVAPLEEWHVQTGGEGELRAFQADDPADFLRVAQTGDDPIVAVLPQDLLAEAAITLEFEPLPDSALPAETGVAWDDLLLGVRERLAAPRRRPLLVPLSAPLLVCYYREDLLRRAKLKPPKTWTDYARLIDRLSEWAPGLTAVEPWGEEFRATLFLAKAVAHARHPDNFSVFVDLETLTPLIDGPPFLRSLQECLAVMSRLPPEVFTYSPLDCRRELLEGRAALGLAFEPAGGANHPSPERWTAQRAEMLEVGFCELPGVLETYNPTRQKWDSASNRGLKDGVFRATLTGFDNGYVACTFRKPGIKSTAIAWSAFSQAAGPDFLERFPAGSAGLTRESQLANSASFIGPELAGLEAGNYLAVVADALREPTLVLALPFPQRARFRQTLSGPLTQALQGKLAPEVALSQVAEAWRGLIADTGPDNFRRAYRQLLGLGAKPDAGR